MTFLTEYLPGDDHHRDKLYDLADDLTFPLALEITRRDLEGLKNRCLASLGQRLFFAADVELFSQEAMRRWLGCRSDEQRAAVDAFVYPMFDELRRAARGEP